MSLPIKVDLMNKQVFGFKSSTICWWGGGINCRCIPCMVALQSSSSQTVPSLSFAWQNCRAATICLSRNASNWYVNWIRTSFLPSSLKVERNHEIKDENAKRMLVCSQPFLTVSYHSFCNINGLLNCNILLCMAACSHQKIRRVIRAT